MEKNRNVELGRRLFLGASGALWVGCAQATDAAQITEPATKQKHAAQDKNSTEHKQIKLNEQLADLETQIGGRLGVYAFQAGGTLVLSHRDSERFAMCSTFKWALAAAILKRVDEGELSLEQNIEYGETDLLEYAPVTRAQLSSGKMSIAALAQASVTLSDNTAANLLLAQIGGPAGLTAFFRTLGDEVTRLDRNEPSLNENILGDARDTTSPRAMAHSLQAALEGETLSARSRQQLASWLIETQTGIKRLRAGFPSDLRAGDKTGTGEHGANNDVAVLWPKQAAPIFVASYLSENNASIDDANLIHAQVGQLVAQLI